MSFNHEKHKNDTQLSNELWKIKASLFKRRASPSVENFRTMRSIQC